MRYNEGNESQRYRAEAFAYSSQNPECPPWLILVEGKKGGKPFVQIEKPLYVRSADGGNSAEMKRIYGLP